MLQQSTLRFEQWLQARLSITFISRGSICQYQPMRDGDRYQLTNHRPRNHTDSKSVEQNKFHSTLALDSMHGGSRRFASSYSNNNYCHLEYFDSINSSRLKVIEEHHPSEGNTKTLLCLVTLNVFNVDYH